MRRARLATLLALAPALAGCSQGLDVFALRAPSRVSVRSTADGMARVEWAPVDGATSYRVYAAPGEVTSGKLANG